jgi:hypothetical protein
MRLDGIDGTHLFGFMAGLGTLALLDEHARQQQLPPPRLHFDPMGTAEITGAPLDPTALIDAVFERIQAARVFYERDLVAIKKPTDLNRAAFLELAATADRGQLAGLAGLACCVGDEAVESSLCAANGASHQNLVQSIRDVLSLVEKSNIHAALFAPWRKQYEVSDDSRKQLGLGNRKPTLRLDPADERLYALRLSNPTTTDDFKTEIGAQALAVPAFAQLPALPRARPVSVASRRLGNRVLFAWALWSTPATLATVRSLLAAGIDQPDQLRARGAFMALRVARVSGSKGKLSFSPSEGVW